MQKLLGQYSRRLGHSLVPSDTLATQLQLSFVVPLFNHVEQTQDMLATLMASLPPSLVYEVVLVDDASTDGTRAWLAGLNDPRFSVVLNPHNCGYAKTNNVGVANAKGEVIGLLNNDLLFAPGWFEPMWAALESPNLNAGIVGNVQHRVEDKALDHVGVILTPRGQFDHLRDVPVNPQDALAVYVTTGACMLMRRADFETVGGFDEGFVNGCEDIDLCFKVRQAGKQIYVAPNSQILHHVSLSRSRVSLQNEKNSQYLYSKWRPEIKLQLTKTWVDLLRSAGSRVKGHIDGELTPSFLSKPHVAALALAEAALLREEARWARDLGSATDDREWLQHVRVSGVQEVAQLKSFLAESDVSVDIDHIKTARNFYVCARLLEDYDPSTLAITLSVNGAHKKTHRLQDGHVINVGLIDPLIFPGAKNQFKVEVYFVDVNGAFVRPAPRVMLISHFVIDDEVVRQKGAGHTSMSV